SIAAIWEAPKYTSSSSGHSCRNKFVQQVQGVTHFCVVPFNHRLAVVMTAPLRKAANCNGRRITCQLRVGKNFRSTYRDLRYKYEKPGLAQGDWRESLADAFGKRCATTHEDRHVGAQLQPQLGQTIFAPFQVPQVIEAEQGGGGIRTAAAD